MASSASEQQLRFRWNDHMHHISKVLTLQRFEEQFCDVTLVSDDGFVMKAHQAILASTSAYFQRIFADITSDQHPMVVLRGANFREMSCLLDYMYQGSTQVHQSLMETVLEVADMLEVKGLSQIRSNNSIKKFMIPSSSSAMTSGSATVTHTPTPSVDSSSNSSAVGHLRSPPSDQLASHAAEDQVYSESQSRSSESENTWIRLSGSGISESHLKESGRSHAEDSATPSVEPPPSSHAQTLHCQDSTSHEAQDQSQVSGMDLSMAKNEPWSPKESLASSDNKDSPAKKRRKLLEGICVDETLEPGTDPDWGHTSSKVDDPMSSQPRTISFTSITSEAENIPRYCKRDSNRHILPENTVLQGSSCKDKESPSLSPRHSYEVTTRKCNAPGVLTNCQPTEIFDSCSGNEMADRDSQSENLIICDQNQVKFVVAGKKTPKSMHLSTHVTLNNTSALDNTGVPINDSDETVDQHYHTGRFHESVPCITASKSAPILSQSMSLDHSHDLLKIELNRDDLEQCQYLPEEDNASTQIISGSVDSEYQQFPTDIPMTRVSQKLTPGNIIGNESLKYTSLYVQWGDRSYVYSADDAESSGNDVNNDVNAHTSGNTIIPVSVVSPSTKVSCGTKEPITKKTVIFSERASHNPLEVSTPVSVNSCGSSEERKGKSSAEPITSFVNLNHWGHTMVKSPDPPPKKALCPLEERLTKPKSTVKRPMNPYILFQSEMKKKVVEENPGEPYQVTLKRLGYLWKHLSPSEKAKWQAKAEDLKQEHLRQHPDYKYSPYEAFQKRQQYRKARIERSQMYRISSKSTDINQ